MVSLARGAASYFKMLFFTLRRANQLTMARKFTGREAASAAQEVTGSNSGSLIFSEQINNKGRREKKGVRNGERPSSKSLNTSYLFMVVIGTFVVSVHVVFHVFDHGIKFGLLFVCKHVTHLSVYRVMHFL